MALDPSYPLRTDRLLIRPLGDDDVEGLFAYRSDPQVCRFVPFEPQSRADIEKRMRTVWTRRRLDAEGEAIDLGVELAGSGDLIGDVMLRWLSAEHSCGEIGYVFSPHHAGHGYATEACRALLDLAFDGLGLHRVVARVDSRNRASAAVASRLGMRQEAHLHENEWFKGEWTDELDFAILRSEWSVMGDGLGRA